MNDEKLKIEERFYQTCAELLGVTHEYRKPSPYRRTRWTNRFAGAGNGRFPGRGLIRMFGERCIHVSLINPRINQIFNSPDAALAGIRAALTTAG